MSEGIRLPKDIREESILTTALNMLSKEGVDGLSMRKLAKAEGISETMLYRFYKNKYEIIQTIFQTHVEKILTDGREFLETVKALIPNLEISLPIVGKKLAKTMTDNQQFLQFIIRDRFKLGRIYVKLTEDGENTDFEDPGLFAKAIQSLNLLEVITDYFKRCKKAGNLRKDLTPKDCAILVISNILPLIVNFPTLVFRGISEKIDIVNLVDIQVKVMLQGLKPI